LITRLDHAALNEVFNVPVKNEVNVVLSEIPDPMNVNRKGRDTATKTEKESKLHPLETNLRQFEKENNNTNSKIITAEGKEWQKLMNLLMQLRKVCNQ
jgi:hypothetical protein